MARSQYIYVVTEFSDFAGYVVAATFTVKHECITWMKRNLAPPGVIRKLHRHSGSGSARTEMDIKKLLEE